jgi:hypothetical protein
MESARLRGDALKGVPRGYSKFPVAHNRHRKFSNFMLFAKVYFGRTAIWSE